MPYAYLVECSDGSLYAGSTWNLEQRLWQHNHAQEGAAYTRRRRPVHLVWAAEFERIDEAFAFEKRIQGWSRAKRTALIEGRYDELPRLASRGHAAVVSRQALARLPQPPVGRLPGEVAP